MPSPPAAQGLRRHAPKVVASLVIAAGFAYMLRRGGLPLVPEAAAFEGVRWWALPLYICAFSCTTFVRCYRWRHLLGSLVSLPLRRVMGVGLVGVAAIVFAPLRMGELVRPYLIADERISFAQATGTVAAERVIDGVLLSTLLMAGLASSTPLSPLPDHLGKLPLPVAAVPAAAYTALAGFFCAFAVMALFYWRRELARRLTYRWVGVFSERLAVLLMQQVEKLADGLSFLPSRAHVVPFLRDSVAYWLLNAAGMWLLLRGCGLDATYAHALVSMGVLGIGILVPSGPGFFGAFQLSLYSALAMYFAEADLLRGGAAYVFILYCCNISIALLSGLVGLGLTRGGDENLAR